MIFHHSTYNPDATIVLYGGKYTDPTPFAEQYTHSRERKINYAIMPPSDKRGRGFQQVISEPTAGTIYADGLLLRCGETATIRSKDCAIVFLRNRKRGDGVLVHAGRSALTADAHNRNIIDKALFAVRNTNDEELSAYIRGCICGRCFVHDMEKDWDMVEPFLNKYPGAVNRQTGGIDLPAIIVMQLRQAGIPPRNIDFDSLCTFEHTGLSSHRGKDATSNMVLVLNH